MKRFVIVIIVLLTAGVIFGQDYSIPPDGMYQTGPEQYFLYMYFPSGGTGMEPQTELAKIGIDFGARKIYMASDHNHNGKIDVHEEKIHNFEVSKAILGDGKVARIIMPDIGIIMEFAISPDGDVTIVLHRPDGGRISQVMKYTETWQY